MTVGLFRSIGSHWTRTTEAHNSILVDGSGQDRGIEATGEITAFEEGDAYAYLCGDAAEAYGDVLEQFDRHVLFVRPGLFVIYDDLVARDSVPFTWLLHGHEQPDVDRDANTIEFGRGNASMATELVASTALSISHTDEYATPVNEGMIEELRMDVPRQHHVYAETEETATARIVAVAAVGHGDDRPAVDCETVDDRVRITSDGFTGAVRIGDGPPSMTGTVAGTDSIDIP